MGVNFGLKGVNRGDVVSTYSNSSRGLEGDGLVLNGVWPGDRGGRLSSARRAASSAHTTQKHRPPGPYVGVAPTAAISGSTSHKPRRQTGTYQKNVSLRSSCQLSAPLLSSSENR